jgi:hypothetical protein
VKQASNSFLVLNSKLSPHYTHASHAYRAKHQRTHVGRSTTLRVSTSTTSGDRHTTACFVAAFTCIAIEVRLHDSARVANDTMQESGADTASMHSMRQHTCAPHCCEPMRSMHLKLKVC